MSFSQKVSLVLWSTFYLAGSVKAQDSLNQSQSLVSFKNYYKYAAATYTVSMLALHQLWYADQESGSFQIFNDNAEWLQVDKVGHAYSAYAISSFSYELLRKRESFDLKPAIVSSASSLIFLSTIEIFDGFSSEWGFSWGDMLANTAGVGVFFAQEAIFKKQIMRLKFSYQPTTYRELRPNLLGKNELQGIFKDYNGQVYWASINLSELSEKVQPKWLNLALGYGAMGMVSANQNSFSDQYSLSRKRQYFLSLDIDFTKINTSKAWVKTALKVINVIKVPSPTMKLNQGGGSKFYWLYF